MVLKNITNDKGQQEQNKTKQEVTTRTMIQISGIVKDMQRQIHAMYIYAVQRVGTTTCNEFDAIMREIHIKEVKLHALTEAGHEKE